MGRAVDPSQVTFLPSSKSRDTKTRTNIKNPARSNLDIVPWFKNQWSVASSHCKWPDYQLSRARDLALGSGHTYCILSCITHRPLPTCHILLKPNKLCARTDILIPTFGGSTRVDLKTRLTGVTSVN